MTKISRFAFEDVQGSIWQAFKKFKKKMLNGNDAENYKTKERNIVSIFQDDFCSSRNDRKSKIKNFVSFLISSNFFLSFNLYDNTYP